jgi:hypothetical protein
VPGIIYDFRAIGGALRKQRADDWWQPAKPGPKAAEPLADPLVSHGRRLTEDFYDPFAGHGVWQEWIP